MWVAAELVEVPIRWYRAAPEAKFLGKVTPFMSSLWRGDRDHEIDANQVGELRQGHQYDKGIAPEVLPETGSGIPCGPEEAWQGLPGDYPPLLRDPEDGGLPICCIGSEISGLQEIHLCNLGLIGDIASQMNYQPSESAWCPTS